MTRLGFLSHSRLSESGSPMHHLGYGTTALFEWSLLFVNQWIYSWIYYMEIYMLDMCEDKGYIFTFEWSIVCQPMNIYYMRRFMHIYIYAGYVLKLCKSSKILFVRENNSSLWDAEIVDTSVSLFGWSLVCQLMNGQVVQYIICKFKCWMCVKAGI